MQNSCTNKFQHYQEILEMALATGYTFKSCSDYLDHTDQSGEPLFVMRHDIDFYPERSINFAEIEYKLGIKSTYFFRVHANEYNCLSYEMISLIRDIQAMGHEIGLHLEPIDIHKATGFRSQDSVRMSKQIIEAIIGHPILGAACHNDMTPDNNLDFFVRYRPQDFGMQYEAYGDDLGLFKNSYYITDSHPWHWRLFTNGQMTENHSCVCKLITSRCTPIYCLTHPHIWYHKHFHLVKY